MSNFQTFSMLSILMILLKLSCLSFSQVSTEPKFFGVVAPATPTLSGFVTTKNTQFLLNGAPFLFNGFNSYWMMHIAANPDERNKVSEVFHDASAAGLTVCRTWAFTDGGDLALQISPGVYDERVFQALDFVISEAQRHGVRLILSLVNNYNDYGGRAQYAEWGKSAGVEIKNDDDFYTDATLRQYYKNHVMRILSRVNTITKIAYKDDPTIMAWELINEPRCESDDTGKIIQAWVQEMATYVKSIDSKHLLEIGMEGFYGDSIPEKKQINPGYQVGTDFIANNLVREIDFATIHAYPDIWLAGQTEYEQLVFAQRWMATHWIDSKTILRKPLVFSEFGKSNKDQGYTINGRNLFLNTIYKSIYNFAINGGSVGGGLVWQIVAAGMDTYYDGYEIVLSQNPSTAGLIAGQSLKMAVLGRMLNAPRTPYLGRVPRSHYIFGHKKAHTHTHHHHHNNRHLNHNHKQNNRHGGVGGGSDHKSTIEPNNWAFLHHHPTPAWPSHRREIKPSVPQEKKLKD
ncbi:hypothetical protein MKX01_015840 [Papaver californicum]|nr:hypothetical protein MKX01_015840 [Papaver californicum]